MLLAGSVLRSIFASVFVLPLLNFAKSSLVARSQQVDSTRDYEAYNCSCGRSNDLDRPINAGCDDGNQVYSNAYPVCNLQKTNYIYLEDKHLM